MAWHQLTAHLVSQDGPPDVAAFEEHQEVDANKLQGSRVWHRQLGWQAGMVLRCKRG